MIVAVSMSFYKIIPKALTKVETGGIMWGEVEKGGLDNGKQSKEHRRMY